MPSNMSNSMEGQSGQDAPQPPRESVTPKPEAAGYAGGATSSTPGAKQSSRPHNGRGGETGSASQQGPDFAALLENPQKLIEEGMAAFTQFSKENPAATAIGCLALGFTLGYALRGR